MQNSKSCATICPHATILIHDYQDKYHFGQVIQLKYFVIQLSTSPIKTILVTNTSIVYLRLTEYNIMLINCEEGPIGIFGSRMLGIAGDERKNLAET